VEGGFAAHAEAILKKNKDMVLNRGFDAAYVPGAEGRALALNHIAGNGPIAVDSLMPSSRTGTASYSSAATVGVHK
jgi:hypothetical protein